MVTCQKVESCCHDIVPWQGVGVKNSGGPKNIVGSNSTTDTLFMNDKLRHV